MEIKCKIHFSTISNISSPNINASADLADFVQIEKSDKFVGKLQVEILLRDYTLALLNDYTLAHINTVNECECVYTCVSKVSHFSPPITCVN